MGVAAAAAAMGAGEPRIDDEPVDDDGAGEPRCALRCRDVAAPVEAAAADRNDVMSTPCTVCGGRWPDDEWRLGPGVKPGGWAVTE